MPSLLLHLIYDNFNNNEQFFQHTIQRDNQGHDKHLKQTLLSEQQPYEYVKCSNAQFILLGKHIQNKASIPVPHP